MRSESEILSVSGGARVIVSKHDIRVLQNKKPGVEVTG